MDKVVGKGIFEEKIPKKKPTRKKGKKEGANHANTFQAETIINARASRWE